jgi:light-regulated signal transduction histidine kinase (bacteriophytochrome)
METISKSVDERLQDALREIETLKQELQHFVYAASHDLQEPLRAITAYSQLLERLYEGDEQARELTSFITTGVARMNALLQNLVLYSRIGASTARSQTQLAAAVQVALFKLSAEIKESAARIDYSDLPTVNAHEVQMGLVFENILRNSLLFRGADPPHIQISCREDDDGYQISVRDNGTGIETRFLNQVLLPFKRLCGKEVPGNGLGLAICDKVIKAHGGRLWLESDGKNGVTVNFTLPY